MAKGINRFFETELAAPLYNPRWSWGAFSETKNALFLRVWQDQIEERDGESWVQIFWNKISAARPGRGEREQHVNLLRQGAAGYGIVCEAKNPQGLQRAIRSFDSETALRLGTLKETQDGIFARIEDRIPIALLGEREPDTDLAEDLRAIYAATEVSETVRNALVGARIGQGKFRADVLARWNRRCAVTGIALPQILRASHVKPWRDSSNAERLDPENGLPLVANLDALFDARFISFDDEGAILISSMLEKSVVTMLGVVALKLTRKPSERMRAFLEHHRTRLRGFS